MYVESSTPEVIVDGGIAVRGDRLSIDIPKGMPAEAVAAVERLVAIADRLAVRCSQLQTALDSRVVIEQAKGVLAERFGVAVDNAFALLRRAARTNRIPIHELAAAVVGSPETPPEITDALARLAR